MARTIAKGVLFSTSAAIFHGLDRMETRLTVICRFAPSPTGDLHAGNLRTALINALLARREGGAFILRFDDTDAERSRAQYQDSIRADLAWVGLDWAREERQSARMAEYAAAADKLKADGRLYPCYETPEELALKRKAALQAGRPPIYDRAALTLDPADRARLEGEGRQPHWRFKLDPGAILWDDLVRGPVRFEAEKLSDPVLIRADGRPLYHLPSVVDDIAFGVTHIVRGEDHVDNTPPAISSFSKPWAGRRPSSPISPCWRARRARGCPSGWARSRSTPCARRAWRRRRWSPISRGSAPPGRSRRWAAWRRRRRSWILRFSGGRPLNSMRRSLPG